MSDFNERIIQIADYYGVKKASEFAKKTGFSHQVASNYLKSTKNPSVEALKRIQLCFDKINPGWLLTGSGDMVLSDNNLDADSVYNISINKKGIPLIPIEVMAGFGIDNYSIKENDIQDRYVVPDFEDVDFMIRVKGDSMNPNYSSGDVVACIFIRQNSFIQWGKVYVIDSFDQGALVKRLLPCDEDSCIICKSDNSIYPDFKLSKDQIRNIALVVGVIRFE